MGILMQIIIKVEKEGNSKENVEHFIICFKPKKFIIVWLSRVKRCVAVIINK